MNKIDYYQKTQEILNLFKKTIFLINYSKQLILKEKMDFYYKIKKK